MSKHRWKGELEKPICIDVIPSFEATEQEVEECYRDAIREKMTEKLDLLMEHYAISDKTDFFHLALALAIDHVPGFRVDPPTALRLEHGDWGAVLHGHKRGRRRTGPPDRLDNLLDTVEETKKKRGLSDDRAALRVVMQNSEEWGPPANHRGDHKQWLETLESRLQDAKRNRREINALISSLNQNSEN
ncbi:MAG: hypothetical protein ACJ8F0_12745 [Xanthobacteraceae bacterium]